MSELPAGFTLDQSAPAAAGGDLPPGFKVDAPAQASAPEQPSMLRQAGNLVLNQLPGMPALRLGNALDREAYREGGNVTEAAAKSGMVSPETAAKLGFAANVGVQAIPVIAGSALAKLGEPALQSAGRQLMQSALKPSRAELASGKGAKAVDTMLEEGINVTPGGVRTLNAEIDKLNDAMHAALARSNATVDKAQAAKALDDLVQRVKMQVNPQSDMATVQKALDEFLNHPLVAQMSDIPVQLAQQLKQGTYRSLGSKSFGELKGAEIEAQKGLARGLKEEIAQAVPEVGPLNAAESRLLNARDIAENRVLMDANKNPMGLGWLAAHPSTWLGFAADRSPLIKSLLARGLHSGSGPVLTAGGGTLGAVAGAELGRRPKDAVPQALTNPKVSQQLGVPPYVPQPGANRLPGRDNGPGMTGARG
jgi:hypothetical protein